MSLFNWSKKADTFVLASDALPIFAKLGVNITDLPEMKPEGPANEYYKWFTDIKIEIVRDGGKPKALITGVYNWRANAHWINHGNGNREQMFPKGSKQDVKYLVDI